ncbi:hypothetical protein HDV00_010899 [Rhizophlyctis rosea]|nr:hypothetical protein HDV00_010899 [Rhizophlyctis rosea]
MSDVKTTNTSSVVSEQAPPSKRDSIIPKEDPNDNDSDIVKTDVTHQTNHSVRFSSTGPNRHLTKVQKESLRDAENAERRNYYRHMKHATYSWTDLYRIRGSVIPRIVFPSLVVTLWGTLWTCLYMAAKIESFKLDSLLITILGVVMGLLLVFRTNTAYDRYWEGRRTWATLLTQLRNMTRLIWITVDPKDDQQTNEKRGAMNLLLAYVVATKHYLRDEEGYKYKDLRHLVAHIPSMAHGANLLETDIDNVPLEISLHLATYVRRCRDLNLIDASFGTAMTNCLGVMVDCLSTFERIKGSPIPMAYNVHLKQTLMLYLLSLPFQLVAKTYWGTIPVIFLASFTLLGIEGIGGEIENPFGYDDNDLPVEKFCEWMRNEMNSIIHRPGTLDPANWGIAVGVDAAIEHTLTAKASDIKITVEGVPH